MLDQRARLLRAALGFITLRAAPPHPGLDALHRYMDTWRGIGAVARGDYAADFDLQLTRYAERGGRANFYVSGLPTRS